jgi:hypothetical protein
MAKGSLVSIQPHRGTAGTENATVCTTLIMLEISGIHIHCFRGKTRIGLGHQKVSVK